MGMMEVQQGEQTAPRVGWSRGRRQAAQSGASSTATAPSASGRRNPSVALR
jgi:hypothetical protein